MKNIFKQLVRLYAKNSGFTLVEIIVATTVFVTATMLFMGVFSSISNNTLLIENTRLAQQDARYAIEQIAAEVRGGWNYSVAPGGGPVLSYESCEDGVIKENELRWIEDGTGQGLIVKQTVGQPDVQVTSSLADVENLNFVLDQPSGMYPLVQIDMKLKKSESKRYVNELEFSTKVGSRVREQVENCGK